MHPALVNELTHFAHERDITITIETEGSRFVETDYPLGLISLSPKFSNSVPVIGTLTPAGKVVDERFITTHNRFRCNTEEIKKMLDFHTDYHFKPVWDGTKGNLEEIEAYRVELDIPKHKTYIMPAGDTREQLIKMFPSHDRLVYQRSRVAKWMTCLLMWVVSLLFFLVVNLWNTLPES